MIVKVYRETLIKSKSEHFTNDMTEMEIEMHRNDKADVRAIGRMLARELNEEEVLAVAGGGNCASGTTTSTWTPQGDDKDTDCDEEMTILLEQLEPDCGY